MFHKQTSTRTGLNTIYCILRQNGYPEVIINSTIFKKIARFYQPVEEGPQKCSVYLKLPCIGNISIKFEKQVNSTVQNCFSAVEPRVIFQTCKILPSSHKDAVPTTEQSLVVYQNVCRCDCRYVGRTSLKITGKNHSTHFQINLKQRKTVNLRLLKINWNVIWPLDFTYFKILTALPTIMIDNFQFWQRQELDFT